MKGASLFREYWDVNMKWGLKGKEYLSFKMILYYLAALTHHMLRPEIQIGRMRWLFARIKLFTCSGVFRNCRMGGP